MRLLLGLISFCIFLSGHAEVVEKARLLTDKTEVYTYLFHEQHVLRNPDCHRQVHESRSPRTMIAMGCKLYELEVGPLDTEAEKRWFKAMYQCEEGNFPFTAYCYLRKK